MESADHFDVLILDGNLTLEQVGAIASGATVHLDAQTLEAVAENRRVLEQLIAEDYPIYGVTTGFGALVDRQIPPGTQEQLQINLLRSHAAGVGQQLPSEVVRAAMAIRVNGLLQANSGIRPLVLERIVLLLNNHLTPKVPQTGSLGASGDLAPSAHAFLALIGEGELVRKDGTTVAASEALKQLGCKPLVLQAKEGLALINGTHFMTAIGALCALKTRRLLDSADVAAALSLEALRGIKAPFDPRVQRLRPLNGQRISAENIAHILQKSQRLGLDHSGFMDDIEEQRYRTPIDEGRLESNRTQRLQDAYSLRCAATVHGAAREGERFFESLIEVDLNAVTDNPLIFNDPPTAISAGNFHGQSLALGFDTLRIALTDLASISERRLFRLLSPSLNGVLPAFLSPTPGLSNGYMIAQYTAAALISELRALAQPVSIDSVSTSDSQEDHVSMGMTAALMTLDVLPRLQTVLAFETLCSCQALDLDDSAEPSPIARTILKDVRERVPMLIEDRPPGPDVEIVRQLISEGLLARHISPPDAVYQQDEKDHGYKRERR